MVISQGSPIPMFMRVMIGVMGVLGLLLFPLGLVLIGVALAALAYTGGTEIDVDKERLREYSALFGMRWGKWRPLSAFKCIIVNQVKRSGRVQGRAGGTTSLDEMNHDVLFVDETHRKKFLVKAFDQVTEAKELAKLLSSITGFPIEVYSPRPIQPRRR